MSDECCANVEKEGNKDNRSIAEANRSLERERWFLLADIGCVLYLDRDVKGRSQMIHAIKCIEAVNIGRLKLLAGAALVVLVCVYPRHALSRDSGHAPRDTSAISSAVEWELGLLDRGQPGLTVLGNPGPTDCPYGKALQFDGVGDALFFSSNPLAYLRQFTVEIIFRPDSDGTREQRFLHMGNQQGNRLMIETRVTRTRQWFLDAHLRSGDSAKTLIDSLKLHPTDTWFHIAVTVNDGQMVTYVNGVRELAGGIPFSPFTGGQTSLGVRQNKVYWFKGAICKVRVTPRTLKPAEFLKLK
jgi:hypothetical protein